MPDVRSAELITRDIALGLLSVTEFTLALPVRGMTLRDYVANRDPIGGAAYIFALLLFALMPLFGGRK